MHIYFDFMVEGHAWVYRLKYYGQGRYVRPSLNYRKRKAISFTIFTIHEYKWHKNRFTSYFAFYVETSMYFVLCFFKYDSKTFYVILYNNKSLYK